jgi:hypothetical protein
MFKTAMFLIVPATMFLLSPCRRHFKHIQFVFFCDACYGIKRAIGDLISEMHYKCSAEKGDRSA